MAEHEQYILRVTAGSDYDASKHKQVLVNGAEPIHVSSEHADASINVRIRDYRGLPSEAPTTSPYFATEEHQHDRYSIEFTFSPKRDISGNDLVFGNDFERPIRDRLPPGFNTAFRFVKWMIDPGLDGDVYADEPYLYGPLLSSINILRIGGKWKEIDPSTDPDHVEIIHEGGDDEGKVTREELGIPDDAAARRKYFLQEPNRNEFDFEEGRHYACDFFNPYLDFSDFSLKLPVITIPIMKYLTGETIRSHALRYVLKDRSTNETLFVIVFSLVPANQAPSRYEYTASESDTSKSESKSDADDDVD